MNATPIVRAYQDRGLSDVLVDRVYLYAYDHSHHAGEEEVDNTFKGLMFELFGMRAEGNSKAML